MCCVVYESRHFAKSNDDFFYFYSNFFYKKNRTMKNFFKTLLYFFALSLITYSCQPSFLDIQEALILRFDIVDKTTNTSLLGEKISFEDLQIIGISLDNEVDTLMSSELSIDNQPFIISLLFSPQLDPTPIKSLIINYGSLAYAPDTLTIDYFRLGDESSDFIGDYTISNSDGVLCHRCHQQMVQLKK
jgi:hypothetical protein